MLLVGIMALFMLLFSSFVLLQGVWAQVLCDLDQIQIIQTMVVNTSSYTGSTYTQVAGWHSNEVGEDGDEEKEEYVGSRGGGSGGGAIFHVKVANNCPCSAAAGVTFFCDGFMQGLVAEEVLRVEGPRCLLIQGQALLQLQPVRFDYASPHQLPLLLESADFTC